MERAIGVLVLGGSLYVTATLLRDAHEQGWGWLTRALVLLAGGAVTVLAVLITLGSTQAAQIMFVGFGVVLVGVMLAVGLLLAGLAIAARRKQSQDSGTDEP